MSSGPNDDGDERLAGLALEEKAARLFWVSVHGPDANAPHPENRRAYGVDTPLEVVRRYRPGGVVLFAWAGNTHHPLQAAALARALRAAAAEDTGLPLAVAIDDEGGRISHLGPPATVFPSPRALARACGRGSAGEPIGDPELAARRWTAGAAELAALGVTVNLAPVTDLGESVNPVLGDRTFGGDPETVAAHAAVAVRGLRAGGVAAVAKHFPGHGATTEDSHETLPVVDLARGELDPHLDTFRRLVATEPPDAIMTAHILVRALDPDRPATLSRAILTDLLRDDLGYEGAVITDSLSMEGFRATVDDAEAPLAALAAGADVPLTPPDLPAAVETVCVAVRDGRLPESRIDEALRRALPLAGTLPGVEAVDRTAVGASAHRLLAAEIARRAVDVREGPSGRLAFSGGPAVVVGVAGSGARTLADALRRRGRPVVLEEHPGPGLPDAGQERADRRAGPAAFVHMGAGAGGERQAVLLVRRVPELDGTRQDALLAGVAQEARDAAVLVETGTGVADWADDSVPVLRTHCAGEAAVDAAADVLCDRSPTS